MPRTSIRPAKRLTAAASERTERRKRVGEFLRARRKKLGLSQGDIIKALGYTSRNSVSNLETGREGLPATRIYAWAEILQVPRDGLFRLVTGEIETLDLTDRLSSDDTNELIRAEAELLADYRRLPPKYQRRLRKSARALAKRARAKARAKKD